MATQRLPGSAGDMARAKEAEPLFSSKSEEEDGRKAEQPMLKRLAKDRNNIALLLFLYVLQGVPLGLGGSIPMVLQAKKIGYRQQALFSFVTWPFSIKLLWAPVVDSFFSRSFGRRKSWLIPMQYALGLTMILLSYSVNDLLGGEGELPNVPILTAVFAFLSLLAATQDIAVDGWALTILSRENVGFASTCNTVGQTAGFFLGYTIFLALESKDFCNSYLRWEPQDTGIVDLPSFLFIWGLIFVVVTTGVWWFKREKREDHAEERMTVFSGYMKLLKCIRLPTIQAYAVAVITCKIAFGAADSVTGLKLMEAGLPREHIALMGLALVPLQIVLPFVISHLTAGPRPLDVFTKAYPLRMAMGIVFAAIVWWSYTIGGNEGGFPFYYYIVVVIAFVVHQIAAYSMFVSIMAFHARVSDPAIGGTYMTLLNTLSNLAGTWPGTMALWLVDTVSFKDCEGVEDYRLDCDNLLELQACEAAGGHCVTHVDGYYVESIACVVIGVLWLWWQRRRLEQLQSLDESAWKAS